MNTTYYALGNKSQFREGGLTLVTMQHGQMGVAKFDTMEDSIKHRDSSHALKQNVAGMNYKYESREIGKSEYHHLIGFWCASVEAFADEWSHDRVPFDIRDAYMDCVEAIGRHGITTWPEFVCIHIGVDFVLSGPHVATYIHI
jgi:hypothetical protein